MIALLLALLAGQSAAAPITAAAFTPDGQAVVLGSQAGLALREWPSLRSIRAIPTTLDHVHDLAFTPDGQRLVVAGGAPAECGTVERFDWPELQNRMTWNCHDDLVLRVAWSADGTRLATFSADGRCQVLDASDGKATVAYKGHSRPALAGAWLDDGGLIASAGVDQTLQIWSPATGERRRSFGQHVGAIADLALRPPRAGESPLLASASEDRTVRIWQPTIGRMARFVRLQAPVRAVIWSTDGATLAAACDDNTVSLLDAATLTTKRHWAAPLARIHVLRLAPGGDDLLVAGDGGARRLAWREIKPPETPSPGTKSR